MANDFAMQAKARSLFSKHLKNEHYQTMVALKDVTSIAKYLKNDDRYATVLESIKENDIHREVLEQKIRLMGQSEFVALKRYVKVGRTNFFEYYIKRREIEQLLYLLHSIQSQVPYKLEYYIDKLNALMELDVNRLTRITTFKELHAYLESTSYKGVLSNLLVEPVSILQCEERLNQFYRSYFLKLISKDSKSLEVKKLFNMDDELSAVEHVYRLKKNYNLSAERILGRIKYNSYLISKSQMKQWITMYDADEFLEAFRKSAYNRFSNNREFISIETYLNSMRYAVYEHHFRFATNTNLTLFAYMNLVQFEISNIVDIIEGVRYEISPDKILSLLVH